MSHCHFIPPYLLRRIASSHVDVEVSRCGHSTLAIDEQLRVRRTVPPPVIEGAAPRFAVSDEDAWVVYTAANGSSLPGSPVRSAGEPASGDVAVDEAYAGIEASLSLFRDELGRDSYDGRGAPVIATVHYERNYDNAFWDGRQLVFGDGDGRVFDRFTKPVDVLAHEFTHAFTQHATGFVYSGQSGALNESVSDVFASCVKQRVLGQDAVGGDWLIGEGIFLPSVSGRALRSMEAPGTAYDDPVIGKDPQVGDMASFVETREDNGGVHINSGIPNRAFHLAATRIGGSSWEGAGRIWYAALTSGTLDWSTDFARFAEATVAAAVSASADSSAADTVAGAWAEVGIEVRGAARSGGVSVGAGSAAGGPPDTVVVRRSGGFAGVSRTGEVSLGDDPRTPEIESLLSRIDLHSIVPAPPQPDRFVYMFRVQGQRVTVGEQALTPELSRLASLVLDD
jgi:hypothetical protein